MFSHDRKVLKTHLDEDTLKKFILLDALKTFKRNITLPKNTLSSRNPGTPRHLFDVHNELHGTVHTAVVDVLNMYSLCCRAFSCLKNIEDSGQDPADVMVQREFSHDAWTSNDRGDVFDNNLTML